MDTFEGKSQKLRIDISSIEIENNNSSSFNRKLILAIRSPRLSNEETPF